MKTPTLLALAIIGAVADKCPQYGDCHDCLNPKDPALDCGWCSPSAAMNADGSKATQCMDHTSKGWACFHLYMHDGCVAGYVCNHTSGQCHLGEPGQGDTKGNCQIGCHPPAPPPPPQYTCNVTSFQCEASTDGHTTKDGCSSACSNSTPSVMVGLWRGLDVQTNYTAGEIDFNFTENSVTWGPLGDVRMYAAAVATLSEWLVRLTLTAPVAHAGEVRYVSYSQPGWPTGPETESMALAAQVSGHQAPPSQGNNIADALGNPDFDVLVLHKCNDWKKGCNFAPAFKPARRSLRGDAKEVEEFKSLMTGGLVEQGSDHCTAHTGCDSCINDPAKVCGWCDGVVTFGDGSTCGGDGNGCCGGAPPFSKCNVAYRKYCPVVCDWTNWTDPSCRAATSKEVNNKGTTTYEDCEKVASWCKYTFGHYCNTTAAQCIEVDSKEECDKNPMCNSSNPTCGSNCTAPQPTQYFYCDTDGGMGCKGPFSKEDCAKNPQCKNSTSCDPTVCKAEVSYVCDETTYQCSQVSGKAPAHSFNTSQDCKDGCYDHAVSGIWRGLRIDSGFVADEWQFMFSEATSAIVTYTSKKLGKTYKGTYSIGAAMPTDTEYPSFEMTITLSTGEKLTGLFDNQDKGPITKFMYLGMPLTSGDVAKSYDDAMDEKKQEFVLIACLPNIANCVFEPLA